MRHITIICFFIFSLAGCKKFLEQTPKVFIAPENYFNNATETYTALLGPSPNSDSSGSKGSVVTGIEMFHKDKDPPGLASLSSLQMPECDEPMPMVNGIP